MKKIDSFMLILGMVIVIAFFSLLGILLFVEVKQANRDLLNISIGVLAGSFTNVVGYFFGSSQGSKIKTEMLNENKGLG